MMPELLREGWEYLRLANRYELIGEKWLADICRKTANFYWDQYLKQKKKAAAQSQTA